MTVKTAVLTEQLWEIIDEHQFGGFGLYRISVDRDVFNL